MDELVFEGMVLANVHTIKPGVPVYVVAVVNMDPALLKGVGWRIIKRPGTAGIVFPNRQAAAERAEAIVGQGLYAAVAVVALYRETDERFTETDPRRGYTATVTDLHPFGPLAPDVPAPAFPGADSLRRECDEFVLSAADATGGFAGGN